MHTLSTTGKLVAFPKTPNPVPNGTAHIKQEHKADQKYSFQIKVIAPDFCVTNVKKTIFTKI